jgi:hypothetical protein
LRDDGGTKTLLCERLSRFEDLVVLSHVFFEVANHLWKHIGAITAHFAVYSGGQAQTIQDAAYVLIPAMKAFHERL